MNNLKIKVIGFVDKGIAELYLYYLDNDENIVATLAVNDQGDLICNVFNDEYKTVISSDINKLLGYEIAEDNEYYVTNNIQVWNNTKKFINDKNLTITYKEDLDLKYEELNNITK